MKDKLFFPLSRGYVNMFDEDGDAVALLFIIPSIFCDIILLPASLLMFLILKVKHKNDAVHAKSEGEKNE